jgi:hypothetical protein
VITSLINGFQSVKSKNDTSNKQKSDLANVKDAPFKASNSKPCRSSFIKSGLLIPFLFKIISNDSLFNIIDFSEEILQIKSKGFQIWEQRRFLAENGADLESELAKVE